MSRRATARFRLAVSTEPSAEVVRGASLGTDFVFFATPPIPRRRSISAARRTDRYRREAAKLSPPLAIGEAVGSKTKEFTGQVPVPNEASPMPDQPQKSQSARDQARGTSAKPSASSGKKPPKGKKAMPGRRGDRLSLCRREQPGNGPVWELIPPRCSRQRKEDLEEVEAMLAGGEAEIAREELIWLLSECPDFLEAHVQLGMIALEEDDAKLARGHFGRAYELVLRTLEAAGASGLMPYTLEANRVFFEAAKGLAHTLLATGKRKMALDVLRRTTQLDPADTLGIRGMLESPGSDAGCGG